MLAARSVFPPAFDGGPPNGRGRQMTDASPTPRNTGAALSCWVITDGKAGMTTQCVGLAEALGLSPVVKRVRLRTPWRDLTPYFRLGGRLQFTSSSGPFKPPWPDLLIA